MKLFKSTAKPLGWGESFLCLALAVAFFQFAYASIKTPVAGLLIFGYAFFLVRLTDQPTVRRAFYFGLAAGFACAAGQAFFFWEIFRSAAIVLWLVFAFWIALFAAISRGCMMRWGKAKVVWLIPFLWTGLEFFRSELYYLKFSWLNVGYAFPNFPIAPLDGLGMYAVGFLVFAIASVLVFMEFTGKRQAAFFWIAVLLMIPLAWAHDLMIAARHERPFPPLNLVGVQLEFPSRGVILKMLDHALAKNTNAPIFVLSEYALDGPVPDSLKKWCREHSRYLVIGGKDPANKDNFYDTAFVVGTNGDIIFKQAKSVPIQFFKDGLPAQTQDVWNSPWGKIGICICYDLSYTRVTDRLVKEGAQLLIVPTMDVEDWGLHEHELHSRVAPVRAAEYGIPIFRVASSGISQAIGGHGNVIAQTSVPGMGEILSADLRLPMHGSIPFDRDLAPFCVGATGFILVLLLIQSWKNRQSQSDRCSFPDTSIVPH